MTSTTEAPSQAAPKQFIEGIGPLAAVSLVVGTMIGSGIFIVSADIGRQVDAWGPGALMIVWIVTGLMTVTGALAYAELAAMIPKAGGQYIFLRDGLSPLIGFLFGWTLFAVIQTGTIAAVAVAFGKFLSVLIPGVTPDVFLSLGHVQMPGGPIEIGVSYQRLVALGVVLVLTVLNARGVTLGAQIQTVFAVAKVGALSVLILLGLTVLRRPEIAALNFSNFWGTGSWSLAVLPVLGAAMVGSLFSADAWNNVTFAAAEVQNPRRNLPLALGVGTATVSLLYVLANVAYLNLLPFHGDPNGVDTIARGIQHAAQDRVGVAAAEVMFGPIGAVLMAIAIMLSTFGCVNGLVLAGPRVYYAMAKDGLFFKGVAEVDPRFGTPARAIAVQAVLASILVALGTFNQVVAYLIFVTVLFVAVTVAALFVLRRRPAPEGAYLTTGYPVTPLIFLVLVAVLLFLLASNNPREAALGAGVVALGWPVYHWGFRRRGL